MYDRLKVFSQSVPIMINVKNGARFLYKIVPVTTNFCTATCYTVSGLFFVVVVVVLSMKSYRRGGGGKWVNDIGAWIEPVELYANIVASSRPSLSLCLCVFYIVEAAWWNGEKKGRKCLDTTRFTHTHGVFVSPLLPVESNNRFVVVVVRPNLAY